MSEEQKVSRSRDHEPTTCAAERTATKSSAASVAEPRAIGDLEPEWGIRVALAHCAEHAEIVVSRDEAEDLCLALTHRRVLLEALKTILDGLIASREDIGVDDWIEIATAAIAKAEGWQ